MARETSSAGIVTSTERVTSGLKVGPCWWLCDRGRACSCSAPASGWAAAAVVSGLVGVSTVSVLKVVLECAFRECLRLRI